MAAASIEPEAVGLEQATTSWKAITDSCMGSALWAQRHQLLRSIHVWQYILRNRVGLYIFILQEYKYVLTWVVASYEIKFKHNSIQYMLSTYIEAQLEHQIFRPLLQELVQRREIRFGHQRKGLLYVFLHLLL
jgi:hypothetical protein